MMQTKINSYSFLSNRLPPYLWKLYQPFRSYSLPVVMGITLVGVDSWLQAPVVTSYLILFLLTYLLSSLTTLLSRIGLPSPTWRLLLATFTAGAVLLLASPVMAQETGGSSCGGGLFGPLASFFSQAFSTAGATNAGNEVCTIFGLIQAILAVVFIIAIGIAAYQVGQGSEIRTAFLPAALALLVVVSSGIIIKLFMGSGT